MLASSRQSSWSRFQRAELVVEFFVEALTETANGARAPARLRRLGSWWVGSFQTTCQSCPRDLLDDKTRAVSGPTVQGCQIDI